MRDTWKGKPLKRSEECLAAESLFPQRRPPRVGAEEKASILVVCLGILAALVLMATTFTTLQRIESKGARNFVQYSEAGCLAYASLAYTLDRLQTAFTPINGNVWRLGAAHCQYSPDPETFRAFYNFTLALPTSDPALTGLCDVEVLDCSSQIYVGSTSTAMGSLQAVLEALMSYINNYQSPPNPFSLPSDAASLVAGMSTYYHSKAEIISKNSGWGSLDQRKTKYQAIKDYLSVYGLPDTSAIKPDLTSQPRVPINLNTVPGPVLAALLHPLLVRADLPLFAASPKPAAEALAGILISNRPFRGWKNAAGAGWVGFVDVLNSASAETAMAAFYSVGPAAWRMDRDEILANFLPHSQVSHGNPSYGISIGKDRLTTQTTEFCLKSSGLYQIGITANIYGPPTANLMFIQRKFEAIVQTHELWKQTTQEDFQTGSSYNPSELRLYPEYVDIPGLAPSKTDGYVGLIPVQLPTAGSPDFYVSFTSGFDADIAETGMADPATEAAAEVHADSPVTDPLPANFPGELLATGSYLGKDGPDGLWNSADDISEAIYYQAGKGAGTGIGTGNVRNFQSTQGTVSFWLQLNFTPSVTTPARQLFYLPFEALTLLGPPPISYSRYLEFFIEGTNLKARYYGWDIVNLTIYTLESSHSIAAWKKGEWHYVGLTWDSDDGSGGSVLTLYADGQFTVATGIVIDPGNTLDAAGLDDRARFGAKGAGAAAREIGTIDEIRSWESIQPAAAADPGENRYIATGPLPPQFVSSPYPGGSSRLPYGVRIGTIAWTEYLPDDGATADISVTLEVDNSGSGTFASPVTSNTVTDGQGDSLTNGGGPFPLTTTYQPGGAGAHLRYRASFTSAAPANGSNYGGLAGPYPSGCGSPTSRAVDTPILDDITITLVPPAKVIAWREILP